MFLLKLAIQEKEDQSVHTVTGTFNKYVAAEGWGVS